MKQKRFDELTFFNTWVVPAAAFWLCAAGFVGGVIAEKNNDTNKPLLPQNVMVLGVLPTHGIQGAIAIGMYSWLFGLAVVDAERKRAAKASDSDNS